MHSLPTAAIENVDFEDGGQDSIAEDGTPYRMEGEGRSTREIGNAGHPIRKLVLYAKWDWYDMSPSVWQ